MGPVELPMRKALKWDLEHRLSAAPYLHVVTGALQFVDGALAGAVNIQRQVFEVWNGFQTRKRYLESRHCPHRDAAPFPAEAPCFGGRSPGLS